MVILIVLVSTQIGFLKSESYKIRVDSLKKINEALLYLKTKIEFTYEPIKNIFEEISKVVFDGKDNIFRKNNIQFLKNGKACIGVVSGEHAIKDLIDICGNKPLGSMCKEGTIRYMFNPEIDTTYINGEKFFINAIHRSDAEDASDDVELYYTYFVLYCNMFCMT